MSRTIRVSIVTPFLNAGRFMQESIESVLAQTCDEWELLLVDDGSTDDSTAIAHRYAAAHPGKIRCLAHEGRRNEGASASRNLGACHAKGEYLAFLDADDVYLPGKLQHQLPLLDAHPDVAMVYAATEYWYSWSGQPADAGRDWIWRKYGAEPNRVITPPRMLIAFLQDGGTVPCMGSVLVRRAAVERVGGWEESFRSICTDQVFHAKLCLRFPVLIADECWDKYRQHDDSSCRIAARAGQSDAAFQRYLDWLETYLSAEAVADLAVWAALRRALRPYRHPLLHRVERRALRYEANLREIAGRAIRRTLPLSVRRRLRARWG
jgi:glycosyltransferase involved in cell wall biosynthesis